MYITIDGYSHMWFFFLGRMDVLDKSKIEEDILKNKAELIKLEVYIKKLQAFKLERELGLQQSTFIKDLAVENQVEMVWVVSMGHLDLDFSIDLYANFYYLVFFFFTFIVELMIKKNWDYI